MQAAALRGALVTEYFEAALALERRELDISDDPDRDVIEGQLTADPNFSCLGCEACLGEIAARLVQGNSKLGTTADLGECDEDMAAIEHFPEQLQGAFGP